MTNTNYKDLKESFISYTSILGDDTREKFIKDYISSPSGIAWELLEKMPKGKYGQGVNMILLAFFIEGDHDWFKMPANNRLGPFAKSDKSWKFTVPLSLQQQEKIKNYNDMRNFVAVVLSDLKRSLNTKYKKKTLPENFDWNSFSIDLDEIIQTFKKSKRSGSIDL